MALLPSVRRPSGRKAPTAPQATGASAAQLPFAQGSHCDAERAAASCCSVGLRAASPASASTRHRSGQVMGATVWHVPIEVGPGIQQSANHGAAALAATQHGTGRAAPADMTAITLPSLHRHGALSALAGGTEGTGVPQSKRLRASSVHIRSASVRPLPVHRVAAGVTHEQQARAAADALSDDAVDWCALRTIQARTRRGDAIYWAVTLHAVSPSLASNKRYMLG